MSPPGQHELGSFGRGQKSPTSLLTGTTQKLNYCFLFVKPNSNVARCQHQIPEEHVVGGRGFWDLG